MADTIIYFPGPRGRVPIRAKDLGDGTFALGVSGTSSGGVTDGDKGDILVSSSGTIWMFDSTVVTAAARLLLDDADAAAQRATLGLGTVSLPSHHNLLGWISDPITVTTAAAPNVGVVYLTKLFVPVDITITNIVEVVNTAGATLTAGQNFCGVFDSAGNRLGVTADQSAAWVSTGAKTMPLTAPVAVTGGPGVFIWIATLANGTTPPSFWRATSNAALSNVGLTSNYRTGNIGTGMTSIPATIAPASISTSTSSPWAAVS